MEPERAAEIVAAATRVSLRIDGTRVALASLTPTQIEQVRASRQRMGTWAFARRFLKASDALLAVEKQLRALPAVSLLDVPAASPTVVEDCASSNALGTKGPADKAATSLSLALVPFVPTAAPSSHVPDATPLGRDPFAVGTAAFQRYLAFCEQSLAWRTYAYLFRLTCRILLYIPLLTLWAVLGYFLLLTCYVLSHPEVLVALFFYVLDLLPTYAQWAGERLFQQLQTELSSRVR